MQLSEPVSISCFGSILLVASSSCETPQSQSVGTLSAILVSMAAGHRTGYRGQRPFTSFHHRIDLLVQL